MEDVNYIELLFEKIAFYKRVDIDIIADICCKYEGEMHTYRHLAFIQADFESRKGRSNVAIVHTGKFYYEEEARFDDFFSFLGLDDMTKSYSHLARFVPTGEKLEKENTQRFEPTPAERNKYGFCLDDFLDITYSNENDEESFELRYVPLWVDDKFHRNEYLVTITFEELKHSFFNPDKKINFFTDIEC